MLGLRLPQALAVLLALAGSAALVGCGGDEGAPAGSAGSGGGAGSQGQGGSGGSGGSGGAPGLSCERQGELDLNGTWLIKARLDVTIESEPGAVVQVCPAPQKGPSELLLLVQIEQSGAELPGLGVTVCDLSLPEVTAVVGKCSAEVLGQVKARVSPSEALRAALPGIVLPRAKGKLGGPNDGASFDPERITFTLGSKTPSGEMASWLGGSECDNPQKPLGTGSGCEAKCVSSCDDVIDADGDGFPGVTMAVCGFGPDEGQGTQCNTDNPSEPGVTLQGKAGLNFRVDPQLKGVAQSSCLLKGSVDAEIVYNVLGADVRLTGAALPISAVREAIPRFDVLADSSQFVAVRVDGKYGSPSLALPADNPKVACQAAIANRNIF